MAEHPATLAVGLEMLARFKARVLATKDDYLTTWYIRTADALIFDLQSIGAITAEGAAGLSADFVADCSVAMVAKMDEAERRKTLWRPRETIGEFVPREERLRMLAQGPSV
jgi:hypothetical protein